MLGNALDRMLRLVLHSGGITTVMPDDSRRQCGNGSTTAVTVRLHSGSAVRKLVLNPELALGEAYMNGTLTIDDDRLQDLLAIVVQNQRRGKRVFWQQPALKLRVALRQLAQNNVAPRAKRQVAHHYDLSGELYDLFLDDDRQYSCAYFRTPEAMLEQAQADMKAHIARKLLLEPSMRVLDNGCGWGGMALNLASDHGAQVMGITLSKQQHAEATERAASEGLAGWADFQLCDCRHVTGTFDRILSIGMFEHVGLPCYDTYFGTIRDLLSPDGVALVHTIGWAAPPDATNPWIAKHIFPGGYILTLSEITRSVETATLWPTDVECWRLH